MKILITLFSLATANLKEKLPAKIEPVKTIRQNTECFDSNGEPGNTDKCLQCATCEFEGYSDGDVAGLKCASSSESTVEFYVRPLLGEIYCGNQIRSVIVDESWLYTIDRAAYRVNSEVDIQNQLTLIDHTQFSNFMCEENRCNNVTVNNRALIPKRKTTKNSLTECFECSASHKCTSDGCRLSDNCFEGVETATTIQCAASDYCGVIYDQRYDGAQFQHEVRRGCHFDPAELDLGIGFEEITTSFYACNSDSCNTNAIPDTPNLPEFPTFDSFQLSTASLVLPLTLLV